MADINLQQIRLDPWYPGLDAWGVEGADTPLGIRSGGGGNVYFVGLAAATYYEAADVNDGTHPLAPKATIQSALDACSDTHGDMIIVYPGNYTLTEALTFTNDSVRMFAWDHLRGESAPSTAILSATDDFTLMTVNADEIEIAGFRIANGSDDANDCIAVGTTGAVIGVKIHDCRFAVGGGYGVNIGSANGTVNDITIRNNTFVQIDDNAGAAGVRLGWAIRADIHRNLFVSDEAGTYAVSIRNASMGGSIVRENDMVILEENGVAIFRAGVAVDVAMHYNRISGGPSTTSAITQLADGGAYAVWNFTSSIVGGAVCDATT